VTKDPCGTCGSVSYYTWQKSGEVESCNDCSKVIDSSPRDAFGQKVRVPTEHLGKYSYAIDGVINSARGYSDYLKKNNLVIKKA